MIDSVVPYPLSGDQKQASVALRNIGGSVANLTGWRVTGADAKKVRFIAHYGCRFFTFSACLAPLTAAQQACSGANDASSCCFSAVAVFFPSPDHGA